MKPKPKAKPAAVVVEEATIADLVPDDRNARKRTARSHAVIADSLNDIGAWRSIAIDEENNVLAGNGVLEAAGEIGITRVKIVEADGNEIVAVRRRGLSEKQKRDYALRDNRASELSEWDGPVLGEMAEEFDVSHLFDNKELAKAIATPADEDVEEEQHPEMALKPDERYNYAILMFKSEADWERACALLKIELCQAKHDGLTKVGVGRVLDGNAVLSRLKK